MNVTTEKNCHARFRELTLHGGLLIRVFHEEKCRIGKEETNLFFRTLRRSRRVYVKFEPAKSVLAYRSFGVGVEEVDEHEFFGVPGKIV